MRVPPGLKWSKHKVKIFYNQHLSRDFTQSRKISLYHSHVKRDTFNSKVPSSINWLCHGRLGHLSYHPTGLGNQNLKQQLKQGRPIPIPSTFKPKMHAWIQFITTPTVDTPGTALLLHFDDKRYIIGNIHEGLTRACIQMGVKLTKASEIFITGRTEWRNTGGLLGLALTLAEVTTVASTQRVNKSSRARDKKPSLTVHGGDNITYTLATGRRFIFRKGMPVQAKEYSGADGRPNLEHGWGPDWADQNLQVWAMVIEPSSVEEPTIPAESKSPRKRSFDDFAREGSSLMEIAEVAETESSPSFGKEFCANVVKEMFASNWQKDTFEELPLAEVAMPAKIFVRNKDTKEIEQYSGPLPGEGPVPDIKVLVRKPWPGANHAHLPPTTPSHRAISYIIRCQRQRGKFLAQKANLLNVPPGRLRTRLASGSDVQLEDGTIIKPEMVLGESKDGGGVVVADLPSQEYVHNFLSRPEWKALEVMTGIEAVIWILGSGVNQTEELQNFINDHKHLKHIFSSPDHCPNHLAFSSSAAVSSRLNQVDSLRYPIPVHVKVTPPHSEQPSIEKSGESEIIHAERGLKINLEPSVSIGIEQIVSPMDISEESELSEDVRSLAEHVRQEILSEPMQKEMDNQHLPSPDAEIICLGTGSATPSKYRNVSATLLRVPGAGSYLLDCGENTLGQLRRLYSPPELGAVLRDLKLIWISHLHADHHLGITSVIKTWYEEVYGKLSLTHDSKDSRFQNTQDMANALVSETRLCIISGIQMLEWLREYSCVENFGFDRLVPLSSCPASARTNACLRFKWDTEEVNFANVHSLLYVFAYLFLLPEA